jgi:hypothetical protein
LLKFEWRLTLPDRKIGWEEEEAAMSKSAKRTEGRKAASAWAATPPTRLSRQRFRGQTDLGRTASRIQLAEACPMIKSRNDAGARIPWHGVLLSGYPGHTALAGRMKPYIHDRGKSFRNEASEITS